jgi:hypothetical protein
VKHWYAESRINNEWNIQRSGFVLKFPLIFGLLLTGTNRNNPVWVPILSPNFGPRSAGSRMALSIMQWRATGSGHVDFAGFHTSFITESNLHVY